MKLSELSRIRPELQLKVDGEFDALGMVTSKFSTEKVLTFIENIKYMDSLLANPNVTGILCSKTIYESMSFPDGIGVVVTPNPRLDFYQIHNYLAESEFYWKKTENSIHPTSIIHPTAVLYDHSIVIGSNCLIEANVVIHPGTFIGNNCIIRSGSQVSTSGFQFLNTGEEIVSVISGGRVVIEDYVEIQHLTCIDKGVFGGDTVIKKYAKIDNLCHIAHDDIIGERANVVAGTALGGRVTLGDDSWTGINSTVSNGITVGENAFVSLGSVVTRDVPDGATVTGNFAIDHQKFLENLKKIR